MSRYSAMSAGDVSSHPKTKVKCSRKFISITFLVNRKNANKKKKFPKTLFIIFTG